MIQLTRRKCLNIEANQRRYRYCVVLQYFFVLSIIWNHPPTLRKVGMMFDGIIIDNLVVGGPAFQSGQLGKGDLIIASQRGDWSAYFDR